MENNGRATSEFSLAKLVIILGVALDGTGLILETLGNAGLHFGWMPPVLVVVGTLTALVAKLGYTRSRTMLKLAAMQPQAVEVGKTAVPFAQDLVKLIREEIARSQKPPEPESSPQLLPASTP